MSEHGAGPPGQGADVAAWLQHLETLHPREMELGLARVAAVGALLGLLQPDFRIITVAGTNGKGSCLAVAAHLLRAAALRTGTYTSPHLLRFNERICIDGEAVADRDLIAAFERVEAAREQISLSYFEFATLAALDIFGAEGVDVAVLEVGLGGRLDAVNIVAPEVAVITSIALDHQDWLGDDREQIGAEKAGIMRARRPVVCGDSDPPGSVRARAAEIGAELLLIGRDFVAEPGDHGWRWCGPGRTLEDLPWPGVAAGAALRSTAFLANASCAIAAVDCLLGPSFVPAAAVRAALCLPLPPGRMQRVQRRCEWVFDVGHNPAAAASLCASLQAEPVAGSTIAVIGMLADKTAQDVAQELAPVIDLWLPVSIAGSRGRNAEELAGILRAAKLRRVRVEPSLGAALARAEIAAGTTGRVVVMGSFQLVGPALESMGKL